MSLVALEPEQRSLLEKSVLMAAAFHHLRSYVDVCSNALLFTLNDLYAPGEDPSTYIDLGGEGGKVLRSYIRVQLGEGYHFGCRNMIVNTCGPQENWRASERGSPLDAPRYVIADDSVTLDPAALNKILDSEWRSLARDGHGDYVFIEHPNLDIFDMTSIIGRLLECPPAVRPYGHLILKDGNDEYIHYDTIRRGHRSEIEILLRTHNIIM